LNSIEILGKGACSAFLIATGAAGSALRAKAQSEAKVFGSRLALPGVQGKRNAQTQDIAKQRPV
jgi:hypothetical protein